MTGRQIHRAPAHSSTVAGAATRPPARLKRRQGWRGLAVIPPALVTGSALLIALVLAGLFTGWNIYRYPHYEIDEGTYLNSAWAMFNWGRLSDYTYTYGHPPFGWFQIGLWATLTGGFRTFGAAINTGRTLMLLLTLVSTLLVFVIVRRASGRTGAALLAALVFAVSPLSVELHRQVYLDNLATVWMLVSLYAMLRSGGRLGPLILSGFAFGLMFWSKEVFAVLFPAMLFLVFAQAHPLNRGFAAVLWSTIALSSISLFVLLALLKDEFLPPGVLWSSPEPHVSFVGSYLSQISRAGGGSLLSGDSDFRRLFEQWQAKAPLLIPGGLVAAGAGLLFWRKDRFLFGISLMIVSYMLFLGRGGAVLFFHLIPVLALLALALGLVAGHAASALARWRPAGALYALALLGLTVAVTLGSVPANRTNFTADRTSVQNASTSWIVNNLPSTSIIVMDSFPWVDLRDPSFTNGRPFWNAHYYWPAAADPEVQDRLLQNNWRNIDYLAFSPNAEADTLRGLVPLVTEAHANSDLVQDFYAGDWSVKIYRIRKLQQIAASDNPMLRRTWESYKARFVDGGRVVDHQRDGITTSEGQAYALLRAVYVDDREAFDQIWSWTQQHLQVRGDGLLAWRWGNRTDGTRGVLSPGSATDADQDAALALLFAARRWSAPDYQLQAATILRGIWERETALVGGRRVVVAGDWARGHADGTAVVNPSYLAPYAYRIFAEADPDRPWQTLVDSSYDLLERLQGEAGSTRLPPNWVALSTATGEPRPASAIFGDAERFSFDASRIPLRLTLDWLWFKDNRARTAIEKLTFLWRDLDEQDRLFAEYQLDGAPASGREDLSMYAGAVPGLLLAADAETAARTFATKIVRSYVDGPGGAHWGGDPDNYYSQNTAWFATALMEGGLSNLWSGQTAISWKDALSE